MLVGLINKAEIGVAVVKILGNGRACPRFDLGHISLYICLRGLRLGMDLGVTTHLNVKVVACFCANKSHQFTGISKLAKGAVPTGQVATQGHHSANACRFELSQLSTYAVAGSTNARKVRGCVVAFSQDGLHLLQGTVLG